MPRGNPNFGTMGKEPFVVVPSQWELFLRGLKFSDREALEILQQRPSESSAKIRNWVNTHYRNVFVPESILELMGLETLTYD